MPHQRLGREDLRPARNADHDGSKRGRVMEVDQHLAQVAHVELLTDIEIGERPEPPTRFQN
jgi:hypothetical protein